jgi:hypothetical protein
MASFVPIQDIDGYISGLKREGFYTDLQIADIRKRHQDALDLINAANANKKRDRTLRLERSVLEKISKIIKTPFDLQVDNVWECNLKIKVRKDGTLKVETVFPFAEFDHWMTYKSEHKPPTMMMVKCLKLAGAPRSVCEEFVGVW